MATDPAPVPAPPTPRPARLALAGRTAGLRRWRPWSTRSPRPEPPILGRRPAQPLPGTRPGRDAPGPRRDGRRPPPARARPGLLAAFQAIPLVRYSGANPVAGRPEFPRPAADLDGQRPRTRTRPHDDLIRADPRGEARRRRPGRVHPVLAGGPASAARRVPVPRRVPRRASGLALWFRKPPRTIDPPEWLVPGGHPVIHAAFEFAGRERHLWLVHPTSPIKHRTLEGREPGARRDRPPGQGRPGARGSSSAT